ncbi:MAG: TraC family protein [Hydrogenophilales bacterium]|nr:TraC family protein [Hydrogenophilales bacterium]
MNSATETLPGWLEWLSRLFTPKAEADDGDPLQFSSYLPYRGWDDETQLFILSNQVGFCVELAPQSGSDQSMADILEGLMHNWPVGTGIQFHLFGTPHIYRKLTQYANLRAPDSDIKERSDQEGRPVRNQNIFRTLARRRVEHLAKAAHESLTRGNVYMLRDFRLVISVTAPIRFNERARVAELLKARAGMETTLRGAGFPSRVWDAADLVNWCADFCNPHRLHSELPLLNYDGGRLLNAQMVDFDTLQQEHSRGIRFSNARHEDKAVEMRAYAVKGYPERFSLGRMGAMIGDLSQAALQYPCPFLITMGVHFPDPSGTKANVAMNQARATQNAQSKMAGLMPDVADKKADWDEALRVVDGGGGLVKIFHTLTLFPTEDFASTAEKAAESIWRDQGFELCHMTHIHRTMLLASLPMSLNPGMFKLLTRFKIPSTKSYQNAVALAPMIGEWRGTQTPTLIFGGRRGQLISWISTTTRWAATASPSSARSVPANRFGSTRSPGAISVPAPRSGNSTWAGPSSASPRRPGASSWIFAPVPGCVLIPSAMWSASPTTWTCCRPSPPRWPRPSPTWRPSSTRRSARSSSASGTRRATPWR